MLVFHHFRTVWICFWRLASLHFSRSLFLIVSAAALWEIFSHPSICPDLYVYVCGLQTLRMLAPAVQRVRAGSSMRSASSAAAMPRTHNSDVCATPAY